MAMIQTLMDGWDNVRNFDTAHTGPGVYLLFDGKIGWSNCVYVGMSTVDTMVRVSRHEEDKDFTQVGLILPATRSDRIIRDIEALVLREFFAKYGHLPPYNYQFPKPFRVFSVRQYPRRRKDVYFN